MPFSNSFLVNLVQNTKMLYQTIKTISFTA